MNARPSRAPQVDLGLIRRRNRAQALQVYPALGLSCRWKTPHPPRPRPWRTVPCD